MPVRSVPSLKSNIGKIIFMDVSWTFLILMPVIVPFFQAKGLSLKEIFFLQAFYSLIVLLFEIPSGYFADILGRKRSLVLAGVLHGLGFSLFPFIESFEAFLLAEFLLAVGVSFFSGADISLLYDSIFSIKKNPPTSIIVAKLLFYKQLSESVAAIFTSVLILISANLPVWFQAGASWLPLFFSFFLIEPERITLNRKAHKQNFKLIFKTLFGSSKLLSLIALTSMAYGTTGLLAAWSFQPYWKELDIKLAHFGILWALSNLIVAGVARVAPFIERRLGKIKTYLLIGITPLCAWFGMALSSYAPNDWSWVLFGVLIGFGHQFCRGLAQVLFTDLLNKMVPSEMRATINSIKSFGVRASFIFWGPVIGLSMDFYGISTAFTLMGVVFLLNFIFLILPLLFHIRAKKQLGLKNLDLVK